MTFLQKRPVFFTNTQKTQFFWVFFWNFLFPFFSCFSFSFSTIKKTKTKSAHFFSKTLFLTPWQTAKKLFSHPYTLFVFFKIPKKHYKIRENKQKKSWTKFWRNLGPSFDSKTPNLGPSFDSTAHIYIYICCCVRKWGAFLQFNRSIMLPFMRSIVGCAESGASNPYFYSVSGGEAPDQLFSRVREISGVILGHHAENEVVQITVLLFLYGIFFWVG